MANGQFITLENGKRKLKTAITQSTGVTDAQKIVKTDSTGKIDPSLLPPGIGADLAVKTAAEDIDAGDFVNISPAGEIRKADASNGRPAHGFVLAAVTTGSTGDVYFEGTNNALSGLTVGSRYYLDTAGDITLTPKSASGEIHQYLGTACSATEMNIEMGDCIEIE